MSILERLETLRCERGAAVIEFAIVAPIFALLTIGVVDMSNAFSRKLALEQGAQRAIEKIMQTTGTTTVEDTVKTEAVCQVNGVNADSTCKTSPISANNVTVTYRLECTGFGGCSDSPIQHGCDDVRQLHVRLRNGNRGEVHPGGRDGHLHAAFPDLLRRHQRRRDVSPVRDRRDAHEMSRRRNIIRNSDGAAAVEMAFALPVLLVMIWMIVQLGEVYRANAGIQQALGEGARYATLCLTPTRTGCTTPTATNIAAKINSSVYGIGPGTFTVPTPVKQTDGTSSYYDLKVKYTQPTSLLLLPGPTISMSRSKRVWVAGT